ncbi:hypothetical protein [Haloferula sp.]|uniref:hypothetical protein n=1 Tax=Haloferula sp. TaxID=2497595 RepID=UPI00329E4F2B
MSEPSRQALAYQMRFGSDADVAMILPLPVPIGTAEDALKFINLKGYSTFFTDLRSGFPFPRSKGSPVASPAMPRATLKVEQVGSFEASFVPTSADFSRLDPRFSIPKSTWDKIPLYADYGFAVFKLRKGEHEAHPMAFTFPTRHPEKLFFPTVHIHDGEVHEKEDFDHHLYCQVNNSGLFAMTRWDESKQLASAFTKPEQSKQLIIGDKHVFHLRMKGQLKNEDVFLGTA